MTLTIADHILFAILAFVLPLIVIWRHRPGQLLIPQDTALKLRIYWLNSGVLWIGALIVLAVWMLGGKTLPQMGFKMPDAMSFPHWVMLIAVFVLLYYADAIMSWVADEAHPAAGILPANKREFLHFGSVVSISAGVCEEIIFRGFLVTYILILLDGEPYAALTAIIVSAFVFGIVHAYQGGLALLKITLLSMLFGWLFVLSGSLWVLIALHFCVDFCSGLIALMKTKGEAWEAGKMGARLTGRQETGEKG